MSERTEMMKRYRKWQSGHWSSDQPEWDAVHEATQSAWFAAEQARARIAEQEKMELVEALKRVLMWSPRSTEAACVQDHNNARTILAKHEQENQDEK